MSKAISARPARCFENPATRTPRCVQLLTALLSEIERLRDRYPQASPSAPGVSHWSDENDLYIEAALPEHVDLHADFCVQDGQVYIRVSR
ncbi:MAG: hypothetical protein U0835_03070 [Isosphaeraceae bacterium]